LRDAVCKNLPICVSLAVKIRAMKKFPSLNAIPRKYQRIIRNKAIERARTRIVVAGGNPADFSQQDLEIVVKEEEDKLKSSVREKGLLAVLALFGINFFS